MEKVRVHYAQRMQSNLDQVAKEKEALRNWQKAMQHETQRVGEVIDLCGKQPGCCRGGPRRRETRGHAAAWKPFISTANLDRTEICKPAIGTNDRFCAVSSGQRRIRRRFVEGS